MEYLPLSFLAGILTVLAPCVLPLLPVIIGGSLAEKDRTRPLIITLSLALSIVLFTLLLKASTLFIDIPQDFWKYFSATIVLLFALSLLFPKTWTKLVATISSGTLEHKSQKVLFAFHKKEGFWSAVVLGAALGPVFASCSPTYFLILGTVLPANFFIGIVNLLVYALGLALVMLIIAFAGQTVITKLNIAADPEGWFKKSLGILFLIVAIGIATGYDKKLEASILESGFFNITNVEQNILNNVEEKKAEEALPQAAAQGVVPRTTGEVINGFTFPLKQQAPALVGLTNWINSEPITSLDELRGKVVLVDFWTYSCINCIRTLPYIQALQEKYADDGLVILSIHTPEFAFEHDINNVKKAVAQYGLTYPVVQDNDFATWRNFDNHYWPAKYLIDKDGYIRYTHFGEGAYDETEQAVVALLGTQQKEVSIDAPSVDFARIGTPETYLGLARRTNFAGIDAQNLAQDQWTLSPGWHADDEKISADSDVSLTLTFLAANANIVLGGDAHVDVYLDGTHAQSFDITGDNLYNVADLGSDYGTHEIRLDFTNGTVEAYAWTFG